MTPTDQWKRETDRLPLWANILYKYGVPSAIALFLVWFITGRLLASVETMKSEMHDHVFSSAFYMKQICVSMAKQAGTPPEACEPPR